MRRAAVLKVGALTAALAVSLSTPVALPTKSTPYVTSIATQAGTNQSNLLYVALSPKCGPVPSLFVHVYG